MKELYYVYREGKEIHRLMKFDLNGAPFAYIEGKWELMPSLLKIKFEDTDYELISEEETKGIMKELDGE